MLFKTPRQEQEWNDPRLNQMLRSIVADAEAFSQVGYSQDLYITSIYRSPEEDLALQGHGIHPLWRAVDVRANGWGDPNMGAVANRTNLNWIYDPKRPAMMVAFFKEHGDGPHCHYQIHPNTRQR